MSIVVLAKILPFSWVDAIVVFLCYLWFGNTAKYGLPRPSKGPIYMKANADLYPVIDTGTFSKIKAGEIEVFPEISAIEGKNVTFKNGKHRRFDAIVLATGYKSIIKKWLEGDSLQIGDDGMPKEKFPKQWKGKNGLYCAGLGRRGFKGAAQDAISIANDISDVLHSEKQKIA